MLVKKIFHSIKNGRPAIFVHLVGEGGTEMPNDEILDEVERMGNCSVIVLIADGIHPSQFEVLIMGLAVNYSVIIEKRQEYKERWTRYWAGPKKKKA